MNYSMKKLIKILSGLLVVLLLLFYLAHQSGTAADLSVYFFDVGQGDAILIRTPSHQNIVIDGGPDNSLITKLGQALPFYDRQIDLMILTHPHDDHLIGLVEVLNRYQVRQVLYSGVLHNTDAYLEWLKIIQEERIPLKVALAGQSYFFGQVELKVLFPLTDLSNTAVENINNSSVVVQVIYGSVAAILVGDLEIAGEEELLQSGIFNLQAQILKVGHHGSNTASSENFLRQISPQYAIIQAGQDNKFGHPALRTLFKLNRIGVKVYRTDLDGDVLVLISDRGIFIKRPTVR